MMASCSNCLYFRPGAHSAKLDGVCRRNPPEQWTIDEEPELATIETGDPEWESTVVTLHSVQSYVGWPDVASHDWCGEYAALSDSG